MTLVEILMAVFILAVGIWATLEIFSPGLKVKSRTKLEDIAYRFARGQEERLTGLPVALVARDESTAEVDFTVPSLSSPFPDPHRYDYLFTVHTVIGEKIAAAPYAFLDFGPSVVASQWVYFPQAYEPLPDPGSDANGNLLPPSSSSSYKPAPSGISSGAWDSWQYTRRYTPTFTYLAFDDYTTDVRWLLVNYSYVDANGAVQNVVGQPVGQLGQPSLPVTETADSATYTVKIPPSGGQVIPGSETVFRVVGTSKYPPATMALDYNGTGTAEGPGVVAFRFFRDALPLNTDGSTQRKEEVALPLPGETLLVNYDMAGHKGNLDIGTLERPASISGVHLPETIVEDHLVPSTPPYEIHLNYKPVGYRPLNQSEESDPRMWALTDSCPIIPGFPNGSPLLAVVKDSPEAMVVPGLGTQSGRLYPDSTPDVQDRTAPDTTPYDIDQVLYLDGVLRFAPEIAGKTVRVYYRAERRWVNHLVKAAAAYSIYLPGAPGAIGLPAIWDSTSLTWRVLTNPTNTPRQFWFIPSDATDGTGNRWTTLSIPAGRQFYQGATVAVEYVYGTPPGTRVSGEAHKIGSLPGGGFGFTLNHPNVTEISNIRGTSAGIKVGWRDTVVPNRLNLLELPIETGGGASSGG